jgi:GntR family transcriptional regulator, transcriptional repressor for pyruvate dehydrogenase complex
MSSAADKADLTSGVPVNADVFKELDRRSLARHAADHLKALIAEGSLAAGDRLPPERELAARLGVSRPTLREAVAALVIIGVLESRQGAGTFVVRTPDETTAEGAPSPTDVSIDLGPDPLESLFELRLVLESAAAERAASHVSNAELAVLRSLLDQLAGSVGDPEQFIRIDVAFHRQIHVSATSPVLSSMLDQIADLALRTGTLSAGRPGVTQRTVEEHRAILEALEARDGHLARAAMIAHLMHFRHALA